MPPRTLQPAPGAWKSLLSEFAMDLESDNKSKKTIRNCTDSVRWLHIWLVDPIAPPDVDDPEAWLDSVPPAPEQPEDYQPRHIRRWLSYRLATTSPGNANNNYRSLQPWFKWLLDEGEITVNPMAKIKAPYVPPQPVPVVPVDLMKRVLKVCEGRDFLNRRDEAIIRLIWDTGGRLAEVAYLNLDDVDMQLRVVHVLGKGRKRRSIPFSAATGKALGRYFRVRARHPEAENTTRLWLSERRRTPLSDNGIKLMLKRRGLEAGVNDEIGRNLHAHLGRHYQSHNFLKAGGSESDLMLLNGWTTSQMPRRYGASAAVERAHDASRKIRVGDLL